MARPQEAERDQRPFVCVGGACDKEGMCCVSSHHGSFEEVQGLTLTLVSLGDGCWSSTHPSGAWRRRTGALSLSPRSRGAFLRPWAHRCT